MASSSETIFYHGDYSRLHSCHLFRIHSLGLTHWYLGELEQAKRYLIQADELQETLGMTIDTVYVKIALGAVYYNLNEWNLAEREFAAIDLAYLERYGYARLQAMALNNHGNALSKQQKFEQARELLEQSGTIWQSLEITPDYGNVIGSIGLTYLEEAEWKTARRYFREAVSLLEPYEDIAQVRKWLKTYRGGEQTAQKELGRKR